MPTTRRQTTEIQIYKNPSPTNPSSGDLQSSATTNGSHLYAGYHTVTLQNPVQVSNGEKFAVVIKITRNAPPIYFSTERVEENYSEKATSSLGQSFISSQVSNVGLTTVWYDLYNMSDKANLCIRALSNPVGGFIRPEITTTDPLPNGALQTPYNALVATGSGTITWTVIRGNLPPGLKVLNNGVISSISGTPTMSGTFSFTVEASKGTEEATKALSVTINPSGVMIVTTELPDGTVGKLYRETLEALNLSGSVLTWMISEGSLPYGLDLSLTGIISGTPTTSGTSTFTVKAFNEKGSDSKPFSIKVVSAGGGGGGGCDSGFFGAISALLVLFSLLAVRKK